MTRVLLVRLSAMGDIVQSLGAARALSAEQPDLELHYVVQREFLPLLTGLDWIASGIPHDRRPGLRGMLRTARRLRRLRPHVALDLQGNWKSAVLSRLSGARRRIGVGGRMRRESGSQWLLSERVEGSGPAHPAHLALDVVRALAPAARSEPPRLVATEEEMDREAAALAALGLAGPARVLVLSNPVDPRAWRSEIMARQVEAGSVGLAGPDEASESAPAGVPVLRHGRGELRRLVALGCHLARAGGEAIGPDRGMTHVLAACGVPTTVLYGPQDPERTAPPGARVLVHPDPPACAPCRQRRCTHAEGPVCMAFTVAEGKEL